MLPRKPTKKGLPRSTKELSREQLIKILKKKKECNVRALRIVEILCEPIVDVSWLLDNLQHINQSHFDDIIVERTLSDKCGYPMCSNELKDVPRQQFKISLSQKAVYDISERKKFCSNACFKSAHFLKMQMLTSPLWFRDTEIIPIFKLFGGTNLKEESSSEVENIRGDFVRMCKIDSNPKTNLTDVNKLSGDMEQKRKKPSLKTPGNDTDVVGKVEQCIREWFNIHTLIYLFGEEQVKHMFEGNNALIKSSLDMQSSLTPSFDKFDELLKLYSLLNLNEETDDRNLKPLPDYTALKADTQNLDIKARAFYGGQLEMKSTCVTNTDTTEPTADNEVRDLPLVDSIAQNALRRRVVSDKLIRVVPDICTSLMISTTIEVNDLSAIIRTFTLSAHNITFKPRELYLIAAIIIKLLSLKFPELNKSLADQTTKERITLLLLSYNLPITYLENLTESLTDPDRIMRTLENQPLADK